jgi:hypothetical protein
MVSIQLGIFASIIPISTSLRFAGSVVSIVSVQNKTAVSKYVSRAFELPGSHRKQYNLNNASIY